MCPFKTNFNVKIATNPSVDAWHGARRFAASDAFYDCAVSRADYEEKGSDWLKENFMSNKYKRATVLAKTADLNASTENDATLDTTEIDQE